MPFAEVSLQVQQAIKMTTCTLLHCERIYRALVRRYLCAVLESLSEEGCSFNVDSSANVYQADSWNGRADK